MKIEERRNKIHRMAETAILLSLVIVFQMLGSFIHIGPTSIGLVLIPIAFGAMLLGAKTGAFLGLAFGCVVLYAGISGIDAFTHILFTEQPVLTSLLCLIKGTAAGYIGGFLYQLLEKKDKTAAAFIASAAIPTINTGLFILGGLLMSGTLKENFVADGSTVIYFLVIGCAGWNYIAELILNLVSVPAIFAVFNAIKNNRK